jgi:hypothetical protein
VTVFILLVLAIVALVRKRQADQDPAGHKASVHRSS